MLIYNKKHLKHKWIVKDYDGNIVFTDLNLLQVKRVMKANPEYSYSIQKGNKMRISKSKKEVSQKEIDAIQNLMSTIQMYDNRYNILDCLLEEKRIIQFNSIKKSLSNILNFKVKEIHYSHIHKAFKSYGIVISNPKVKKNVSRKVLSLLQEYKHIGINHIESRY